MLLFSFAMLISFCLSQRTVASSTCTFVPFRMCFKCLGTGDIILSRVPNKLLRNGLLNPKVSAALYFDIFGSLSNSFRSLCFSIKVTSLLWKFSLLFGSSSFRFLGWPARAPQARRSGYDESRKTHIQSSFKSFGNWLHPVWAWHAQAAFA